MVIVAVVSVCEAEGVGRDSIGSGSPLDEFIYVGLAQAISTRTSIEFDL